MKTATFVKSLNGWQGDARVYKLEPPMNGTHWAGESFSAEFVVVSSANTFDRGPETFIFKCDGEGKVESWSELDGSETGIMDHAAALNNAGYQIQK